MNTHNCKLHLLHSTTQCQQYCQTRYRPNVSETICTHLFSSTYGMASLTSGFDLRNIVCYSYSAVTVALKCTGFHTAARDRQKDGLTVALHNAPPYGCGITIMQRLSSLFINVPLWFKHQFLVCLGQMSEHLSAPCPVQCT